MNHQLQAFARQQIKKGLAALPDKNQRTFKLMYGRASGQRSVEDALALDLNAIVDEMPADQLDWAMQQVQRSLEKEMRA